MERKQFVGINLKTDADLGIVEHIVAVMGNLDQGNDIIHPGAFTKTLAERGAKVRVLDDHRTDSVLRVIGKPLAMRELNQGELPPSLTTLFPEATGALWVRTQFLMDTPEGMGVFKRIKEGLVDEYSIGYDPLDFDYERVKMGEQDVTVRNLRTIKLYEYSPVIWGMNEATTTLNAKAASGAADLPLGDRAAAWDSAAAEGRVREWAGAADATNAKYARAFFYVDQSAPDNFGSYKLQFADVVDGELTAMPRGIFAVAAALSGSRGGVDIPEADQQAIKRKVSAYYQRMATEFEDESIVAPWDKGANGEWQMKNEKCQMPNHEAIQAGHICAVVGCPMENEKNQKAGRVLAQRNVDRLVAAMRSMMEALAEMNISVEDLTLTDDDTTGKSGAGPETPPTPDGQTSNGSKEVPTQGRVSNADRARLIEVESKLKLTGGN